MIKPKIKISDDHYLSQLVGNEVRARHAHQHENQQNRGTLFRDQSIPMAILLLIIAPPQMHIDPILAMDEKETPAHL